MSEPVALIGAGGHARSLLAVLQRLSINVQAVYDDSYSGAGESILGCPVAGDLAAVPREHRLILAVGSLRRRAELVLRFSGRWLDGNVVHPQSILEPSVSLGRSNQVLAGAVLNACARIGDHNIMNTRCVIEHETVLGDLNHISVGAVLCGRVEIGDRCFIGAGAVIIDKVRLGSDITIGANSVVIRDVLEPGVYVGNPSHRVRGLEADTCRRDQE